MLSQLPLRLRLLLLAIPSLCAALVLGGLQGQQQWETSRQLSTLPAAIGLLEHSVDLIDALQSERGLTNGYLRGSAATVPDALQQARAGTDVQINLFVEHLGELSQNSFAERAQSVSDSIRSLISTRAAMDSRSADATETFNAFSQNIDGLINLLAAIGQGTSEAQMVVHANELVLMACVKEYLGRERGFVNGVLAGAGFSVATRTQATVLRDAQQSCVTQLQRLASPLLAAELPSVLQSAALDQLEVLRKDALADADVTPQAWFAASSAVIGEWQELHHRVLDWLAKHVTQQVQLAQGRLLGLAVGLCVMLVVLVVLVLSVLRSILHPIHSLTGALTHAAHSLDLTRTAPVAGRDEISAAARAFNDLLARLNDTLSLSRSAALELEQASEQLDRAAENMTVAGRRQSDGTATVAAAVEELTVSIGHVADNAEAARQHADHARQAAEQGDQRLSGAAQDMQQVANDMQQASETVDALKRRSTEISRIVDVIAEVANRTNLLALNAAIEAARAGEQGRGFSVVADEVRKLAEQTSASTQEISRMVAGIAADTEAAVQRMGQGVEGVNAGATATRQVQVEISQVLQGNEGVAHSVRDIAGALNEQREASQQVAGTVESIARAADDNLQAAEAARTLARTLHDEASRLRQAIEGFRLRT